MYPKHFFLNPPAVEPQTCFVLMPFAEEFDAVYRAIVEAVEGPEVCFSSCRRADELFGGGHIVADILDRLARGEIIIADVTNRNPNVFYELGIAHTVKDIHAVVIIAQSMKDVPFDLSHLRCIEYSPSGLEDLKRQIVDSIRAITPAGLRFAIQDGKGFSFPNRLPGPDRFLYDFDVGPVIIGKDFAKFRIEIPLLHWRLNLDRVSGDKAHFCLCEPASES